MIFDVQPELDKRPRCEAKREDAMGEKITLTCKDGQNIGAYLARPEGTPKGAIVVLQEIFGANQHIRKVADLFFY